MTKLQVVAYDPMSNLPGHAAILKTWKVAHHHGKRKMAKLKKRVNRYARTIIRADKSSDHIVYVRSV
jgi:hypothetical protein